MDRWMDALWRNSDNFNFFFKKKIEREREGKEADPIPIGICMRRIDRS